ncbi:site-specific integrase [Lysobacter sp. Root983]|uniref:tyrosine-type recombinase/integrase n=1 Tax=Lysobacter sp. Root983 TaxID=1736613 RepID=UPI001F439A03|nr:site-specific integrase [Lysobacter sp. Root983]
MHSYRGASVTQVALKLAPMLFVRPGEQRKARWADIDLVAAKWRFTASKTGMPHIVPLPFQARDILEELQPLIRRSEFIFPGVRSAKRPMSENTINAALRYLGFDGDTITGHGFRAMARTVLDEVLGFRSDYIEHQLAHAVRDPLGARTTVQRTFRSAERWCRDGRTTRGPVRLFEKGTPPSWGWYSFTLPQGQFMSSLR